MARQQLVGRLDGYMSKRSAPIFRTVLQIIDDKARGVPDVLEPDIPTFTHAVRGNAPLSRGNAPLSKVLHAIYDEACSL